VGAWRGARGVAWRDVTCGEFRPRPGGTCTRTRSGFSCYCVLLDVPEYRWAARLGVRVSRVRYLERVEGVGRVGRVRCEGRVECGRGVGGVERVRVAAAAC
jgi:hypothetical protein